MEGPCNARQPEALPPVLRQHRSRVLAGHRVEGSITYYSGRSYQRNFVAWMEGVGYDIELGESPNLTARVLWRIAPQTASSCRFSIEVIPYLKADLEDAQKARYLERLFGDHLQHYLDCVVKGVDY